LRWWHIRSFSLGLAVVGPKVFFAQKFCGINIKHYLSPLEKILSLERTKKNEFSFGSLLAYSYLCRRKRE
jgi:hypothetical protein